MTATTPAERDPRLQALRLVVIVPALNEADSLATVIAEIRSVDPHF